jgi:hypothetical protein
MVFCTQKEGRIPHIFVEVDFSEVTRKKAMLIAAKELLLTKLGLEPKISIGASFFSSLLHKLILC